MNATQWQTCSGDAAPETTKKQVHTSWFSVYDATPLMVNQPLTKKLNRFCTKWKRRAKLSPTNCRLDEMVIHVHV